MSLSGVGYEIVKHPRGIYLCLVLTRGAKRSRRQDLALLGGKQDGSQGSL